MGRHNTEFPWTDERVAALKALWATGATCPKIARALDPSGALSRNAVIGKVRRLNLSRRDKPVEKRASPTPKVTASGPSLYKPPSMPAPVEEPPHVLPALTLATVGFGQCRWIHGAGADAHLCGQPTTHVLSSWCGHHLRRVKGSGARSERGVA